MAFPRVIKAEVKLTTGANVTLSARELDALDVAGSEAVGIIAVLFVGVHEAHGRWLLVDAAAWRGRVSGRVSASRLVFASRARTQPWLDAIRQHVDDLWPSFLDAWKEVAARGHEELLTELERCHRERTLASRLPKHEILDVEHRESVAEFVAMHGEAAAGRLVQDLFAYLVALAGYGKVTNNAVGVPDFVLEQLDVTVPFAGGEATRL